MDKHKEEFYRDKDEYKSEFTHVIYGVPQTDDAELAVIDEHFGAADVLSIQNAEKHRKILLWLSVAGTLLTLFFLLYDEVEAHGLILACGAMLLSLYVIRRLADKLDCHRKYIEYRVLAESLRVQFFLTYAGLKKRASDLIPWNIRKGLPWVEEVLLEVGEQDREAADTQREKKSVLDCWITDQKTYHERALVKTEKKLNRDEKVTRVVIIITLLSYLAALGFEIIFFSQQGLIQNEEIVRVVLKVLLGTMSAITIFTGSYYGKMSLPNIIDDHRRMGLLFEKAENDISKEGETEELLLDLARECLNENSAWYSYQSKNSPDIVM